MTLQPTRMVVILKPEDFDGWLSCPVAEAKTKYCKQYMGELDGTPAPLPKRPKSEVSPKRVAAKQGPQKPKKDEPPEDDGLGTTGSLF